MTEKKTKKKARSEETLAEKLARQTVRYQHLNKQVRAVGRIAFSSVTREQVALATQYLNAKEALEKTKAEVDQQANEIAQLKEKVAELEDEEKDKEEKAVPLEERIALAKKGDPKDLDLLVHDPHPWVRMAVLEQGREQDLKILQKDTTNYVRRAADKKLLVQEHDKENVAEK